MKDLLNRTASDSRRLGAAHSGSPLNNPHRAQVAHGNVIWTVPGTALGTAGISPLKYRLPYVGNEAIAEELYAQVGTQPGATALQVTVYKNGSNLLTGGAAYVSIGTAATSASVSSGFVDNGSLAKDDYFQLYIVQADSVAADLVFHMRYYWILTNG